MADNRFPSYRRSDLPGTETALDRATQLHSARAAPNSLGPLVSGMHQRGMTLRQIGAELTERGVLTSRGGPWTTAAVQGILNRA